MVRNLPCTDFNELIRIQYEQVNPILSVTIKQAPTLKTQIPHTFCWLILCQSCKKGKGLSRIVNAAGYSLDGFKRHKFEAAFRQVLWLNLILFTVIIFMPLAPHKMILGSSPRFYL